MEKKHLVHLKVVEGIMPLGHVAHDNLSGIEIWRDIINDGHPEATESLTFIVPDHPKIELKLTNYRKRGGISNAELQLWLESQDLAQPGTLLPFEVIVDEEHNVTYKFVGKLKK